MTAFLPVVPVSADGEGSCTSPRHIHSTLLVPLVLVALSAVACEPGADEDPTHPGDSENDCAIGVFSDEPCLDPLADEDGDNLRNRLEYDIGTDPTRADSDGDGANDGDEYGTNGTDTDGDGAIDALESSLATADADGDCLPDQFDPHNEQPDDDPSRIMSLSCRTAGVCGERLEVLVAVCRSEPAGQDPPAVVCDYGAVDGFEETDVTCDGRDNDCDGSTDEDLGCDRR